MHKLKVTNVLKSILSTTQYVYGVRCTNNVFESRLIIIYYEVNPLCICQLNIWDLCVSVSIHKTHQ